MRRTNGTPFAVQVRHELFALVIDPFVWLTLLLFAVALPLLFFVFGSFFTFNTGTINLPSFFRSVALASVPVVPALSLRRRSMHTLYEETLPVTPLCSAVARVLSLLAAFAVFLLATVPSLLVMNRFGVVETAPALTSYAMLLCYACASISFCVFLSACIENALFSYLLTLLLFIALHTVHLVPFSASSPRFLTGLAKGVSFMWHFEAALKGIFSSQDAVFFLAVGAFFIVVAGETAEFRKNTENRKPLVTIALYAGILVFLVLNGALFPFTADTTRDKLFSLSPATRTVLSAVHEPVSITYYVSRELKDRYPQVADITDLLREYAKANRKVGLSVVTDGTPLGGGGGAGWDTAMLERLGIQGQRIETREGNRTVTAEVFSGITIECAGMVSVIPFVISVQSLEYNVTLRLRSLLRGVPPLVYALVGNGLSLDTDYRYLVPWLNSAGFAVAPVNSAGLLAAANTLRQEPDAALLVLGASELGNEDTAAIESLVMGGLPAFFAVSPNAVDIRETWNVTQSKSAPLLRLLSFWGADVSRSIVFDDRSFTLTLYGSGGAGDLLQIPYGYWPTVPGETAYGNVQFYWASPIALYDGDSVTATPLCVSGADAVAVTPDDKAEPPFVTNPFLVEGAPPGRTGTAQGTPGADAALVLAARLSGEFPGYYTTGKSKKTRFTVAGDQYFLSNMVENTGSAGNFDFLVSELLRLLGDGELVAVKDKGSAPNGFTKVPDKAGFDRAVKSSCFMLFVLEPALILCLWAVTVRVRKACSVFGEGESEE